MNSPHDLVLNYHQRTKHRLERYANGPETLDWDDQPEPFRRFSGCELIALPRPGRELAVLFTELDTPQQIPAHALTLESIGLLLELAFGLSAWKSDGFNRWALRCNPSSGNLHPTEAYLISVNTPALASGVYHYASYEHSLEQRALFSAAPTEADIFIGLSSIHWREAWKYGERAYRYCQHDVGHALGALRYAAATLGWSISLMDAIADAELATLLGVDRDTDFIHHEHEVPDVLCRIHTSASAAHLTPAQLAEHASTAQWFGCADSLRAYHAYSWPVLDEVSNAAAKPRTAPLIKTIDTTLLPPALKQHRASTLIRQRRSAQQFDGNMPALPSAVFYRVLSAVLPQTAAFAFWPWRAAVHVFIFVHRVEGLTPGLYVLLRDHTALKTVQAATSERFVWQPQHDTLAFYLLHTGDMKQRAKTLSCHQSIASDSAFSLAMVAEFSTIITHEPWRYRQLFWECGLIGQILYLEAEAAGMRSTGIGCYFDDSVHELLGLTDNRFQSLYHFTLGKAQTDARLHTLPAYAHLP
jgi:SagB-type dehydrogenase family enzyme